MLVKPAQPSTYTLEVKKSRFIAHITAVTSKAQALDYIAQIKQQYPDAGHHCWAYISHDEKKQLCAACYDDGEPSNTAGKPILNVLEHNQLHDVVAVVVRYFGGVKLGAGGLVRAYSSAASEAVKQMPTEPVQKLTTLTFSCAFSLEQQVRHLFTQYKTVNVLQTDYTTQVNFHIELEEKHLSDIKQALVMLSKGGIVL